LHASISGYLGRCGCQRDRRGRRRTRLTRPGASGPGPGTSPRNRTKAPGAEPCPCDERNPPLTRGGKGGPASEATRRSPCPPRRYKRVAAGPRGRRCVERRERRRHGQRPLLVGPQQKRRPLRRRKQRHRTNYTVYTYIRLTDISNTRQHFLTRTIRSTRNLTETNFSQMPVERRKKACNNNTVLENKQRPRQ
jgi:hypothetical protein